MRDKPRRCHQKQYACSRISQGKHLSVEQVPATLPQPAPQPSEKYAVGWQTFALEDGYTHSTTISRSLLPSRFITTSLV